MIRASSVQLVALDAYIAYGTHEAAAYRLHISVSTLRRRLDRLRVANGMSTAQLAFYRGIETREAA